MTRTLTLALLAALCLTAYAQDSEGPKPDRWRGLVIDQSTPDDAINVLGAPESDKTDRMRVVYVDDRWLTKDHKEKQFRRIEWKHAEGMKRVVLFFRANRLVMIDLWLEKESEFLAASLGRGRSSAAASRSSWAKAPSATATRSGSSAARTSRATSASTSEPGTC